MRKMTCNYPKLDLAKMYAYIKLEKILPIDSQDIERKRNFGVNKGNYSGTSFRKMTCNNPKLDLVNIYAYIKFGENMSGSSQKTKFRCKSRAIALVQMFEKLWVDNVNINAHTKFS